MANTLIQTLVPDNLRGRVVSIYTLGFFGTLPRSSLLAGGIAESAGDPGRAALPETLRVVQLQHAPGVAVDCLPTSIGLEDRHRYTQA